MKNPLTFIYDTLREDFGIPVSLYRLLESRPGLRTTLIEPEKNISSTNSVVAWHEWCTITHWPRRRLGELMGWKYSVGSYSSFFEYRDEFSNIGSCEIKEDWECDIQDVSGLLTSKSELAHFASLDELVETNSRDMIDTITEEKLRKNLAHDEIRIINPENLDDSFERYLWDGRLFLMNSGGSHHFAAARYIAARINIPVPLKGKLRTYSLNKAAIDSLQRDFDMFVISNDTETNLCFHDAMQSFRATYIWQYMPRHYEDSRAILLPKSDPRSMKVASVLREAGFIDLGNYLSSLAARQMPHLQKRNPAR